MLYLLKCERIYEMYLIFMYDQYFYSYCVYVSKPSSDRTVLTTAVCSVSSSGVKISVWHSKEC